jgi:hypothetical protein
MRTSLPGIFIWNKLKSDCITSQMQISRVIAAMTTLVLVGGLGLNLIFETP